LTADEAEGNHPPPSPDLALPVVEVKHLSKRFGRTLALDDVSFSVRRNEAVLLAGPNGSGKSTLLKILTGITKHLRHTKVSLLGLDPWLSRAKVFAKTAASFEDMAFPDFMTARDYVAFSAESRGVDPTAALQYASGLFGIPQFWDESIRTYSSGMKRKTALAQALAFRSELLILDEPFVALDAKSRKELVGELLARKQAGITIIISSHVITGLDALIDRILVMSNGKLVFDGANKRGGESLSEVFDRAMESA
jgi:ABC-type multidrug transport system ATPase subunit